MERATELVLPEPILIEPGDTLIPRHSPDVVSYSTALYQSEYARTPDVAAAVTATPHAQANRLSIPERWRTSTTRRKIGAIAALATTVLTTGIAVFDATPAAADGAQIHQVYNTGDGLWLHPDEPKIHSKTSDLMRDGDDFAATCWKYGDDVNGDSIWLHGTHIATGNTGDAADYFINSNTSQGDEAQQLTAQGLPECNTNEPSAEHPMKSVFYSPLSPPGGIGKLLPADINLPLKSWSSGDCSPNLAANVPTSVDTLAGWSVGRLGPIYFLYAATADQVSHIHRIVLFDPGASDDIGVPSIASQVNHMRNGEPVTLPCDTNYDINGLLAEWLKSDSSNKLVVVTGQISEMKNSKGESKYNALWKSYFAGIWDQSFASQALVCDYNNMSHTDVLQNFYSLVNNPQEQCPADPTGDHQLTSWNP